MKASRVNGDGSFIAHEVRTRSTPASARSMCSAVLITVPQVPSSSKCDSSMSMPRYTELHGISDTALAPCARMPSSRAL